MESHSTLRMRARRAGLAVAMTAVMWGSGCANHGNFITGDPPTSQMKTSLSHVQYENEKLRTEVAKLKDENRSLDERLVQEQLHNGDLAARLDDARNLLRGRGIDGGSRLSSRSADPDPDDSLSAPVTKPAARKTVKKRKPPAASIPGDLEDLPTASDRDDSGGGTISLNDPTPLRTETATRTRRFGDDPEPDDKDGEEPIHWRPVADGSAATPPTTAPRR